MSRIILMIFCFLWSSSNCADSFWSDPEIRILRSLSLDSIGSAVPSTSNIVAKDPLAIQFGQQLFFDARLSANGKIACASCHQPQKLFTDGRSKAEGIGQTQRNTPTLLGAGHQTWFYWDGRRDSLWSQALVPFEALAEMGSNRMAVVRFIAGNSAYRRQYEKLFGRIPSAALSNGLPTDAGPFGSEKVRDNWYRLSTSSKTQINKMFANLGKSIAAYERTLKPRRSRFDRYVNSLVGKGQEEADGLLAVDEKQGLKLFIDASRTQCLQCHNGPLLTNGGFHNIGSGNFSGEHLDFGRELGLNAVFLDPFNCLGNYSDAKPEQCSALRFLSKDGHTSLRGSFKTPTLRGLSKTAPFFHDGSKSSLGEVIRHYHQAVDSPDHELKPMVLTQKEVSQLVAFLNTL